jgi:hypothetical protein
MKCIEFLVLACVFASFANAQDRPRVFVGESETFFASSFGSALATGNSASAAHTSAAGIEKMTVLTMKALNDKCPAVTVVNQPDKADYFLRLDRNGFLIRSSAIAVFNRSGEMVFVAAGVNLGKEIKRFCSGIPYQTKPAASVKP